jgi:hypothetical protein
MGHFTEETLQKFQEMCAAGIDFGEGPAYDFAMCIKADGDIYGISPGETCRDGKPISDAKAGKKEKGGTRSRMSKLRAAFIKKLGREMTSKELEKARNMLTSLSAKMTTGASTRGMISKISSKKEKTQPTQKD